MDNEIKKLLNLPIEEDPLNLTEPEVERLINEIFVIKDWLNYVDNEGNLLNSIEFNQRKKKEKVDLIETITTNENRQLINQYIENLNEINNITGNVKKVQQILSEMEYFQNRMDIEIEKLNEDIDIQEDKIPFLNISIQIYRFRNYIQEKDKKVEELYQKNLKIDTKFKNAGIKIDVTSLLEQIGQCTESSVKYD